VSFDWATFVFQAINFVVLVFILWRLLWKPLRTHMAARAETIRQGLEEAEAGRTEAERLRKEAEDALARSRRAEEEAAHRAEAKAEARRAELIAQARTDAAAERDRMLAQVRAEQQRREAEFLRSLGPELAAIVARIVGGLGRPDLLHEAACARFAAHLRDLPDEERKKLAGVAKVDVATAREGVPDELRDELAALFPAAEVSYETDDACLAGARLRAGEFVYDGSLRAQVKRALEERT
jgi:F-type H+-transporting ATPase subunit b